MLDDERPARRQPDLAVQRLAQLFVHVVALEQRQRFGLRIVVRDPVNEGRVHALHVGPNPVVHVQVINHHAAEVLVELLPDETESHLRLAVKKAGGLGTAG